ncbi:MAG: hypothetical protein PWR17_1033 [Candidatus Methanomethylophilaceae archaeon]|nr:hypothetical protein [Candidatus Methanomethylophilaceae archaeon]
MRDNMDAHDGNNGLNRNENGILRTYVKLRNEALAHIGSEYRTIRAFAFLLIIADTGLSPDEVRKLEIENIDHADSIGLVSCRTRGINDDSCISVNLQKASSDVLDAYMESRRALLDEYSFDSPYLFPSRITINEMMPPEAIEGIADTVSEICGENIDIELLRETFGPQ